MLQESLLGVEQEKAFNLSMAKWNWIVKRFSYVLSFRNNIRGFKRSLVF